MPHMYLLRCADGSFYTGSTRDLNRRLAQHQAGEGARYTARRRPVALVYCEHYDRVEDAFWREKQVQGWSRKKKQALIDSDTDRLHELAVCQNETRASDAGRSAEAPASSIESASATPSLASDSAEPVERSADGPQAAVSPGALSGGPRAEPKGAEGTRRQRPFGSAQGPALATALYSARGPAEGSTGGVSRRVELGASPSPQLPTSRSLGPPEPVAGPERSRREGSGAEGTPHQWPFGSAQGPVAATARGAVVATAQGPLWATAGSPIGGAGRGRAPGVEVEEFQGEGRGGAASTRAYGRRLRRGHVTPGASEGARFESWPEPLMVWGRPETPSNLCTTLHPLTVCELARKRTRTPSLPRRQCEGSPQDPGPARRLPPHRESQPHVGTERSDALLFHHTPPHMARVRLNPIVDRVQGAFGDIVFRTFDGKTVISRKAATPEGPPSPAQEAQRDRFRDASYYGRVVLADPTARAFYEAVAKQRKKPVFSVIVGDFLNAPTVQAIDDSAYTGTTGDPIVVQAQDDVEVTGVTVTLTDDGGTVLETGPASRDEWRWRYGAQTDVPAGTTVTITAVAMDRPGNTGGLAVDKTIS